MKAVGLTRYLPASNPDAFIDTELPEPTPGDNDLLVSVQAVSVNPVDTKVRAPRDTVEQTPRVLGWDAAGIVNAIGPAVTQFAPGDHVYYAGDITRPGCNSERHCVDARITGRMPGSASFSEAAALPLTGITAWEALFERLRISPEGADAGRSILIVGGAGGVGGAGAGGGGSGGGAAVTPGSGGGGGRRCGCCGGTGGGGGGSGDGGGSASRGYGRQGPGRRQRRQRRPAAGAAAGGGGGGSEGSCFDRDGVCDEVDRREEACSQVEDRDPTTLSIGPVRVITPRDGVAVALLPGSCSAAEEIDTLGTRCNRR